MKIIYNSTEEKIALIVEYESKGLTLVSDNGTLENGNFLEFREPQPPTLEEQLADKERQILELKENQFKINRTMEANVSAQQELLELLIDMGVL